MDDLIFLLVIIGVVLVVAVVAYTYIKNNKKIMGQLHQFNHQSEAMDDILLKQDNARFNGRKTDLSDDNLPSSFATSTDENILDDGVIGKPRRVGQQQKIKIKHLPLPPNMDNMIIAMSIQRNNHVFSGEEIVRACKQLNLKYGDMNIFHYPGDDKPETFALFSMANMLEPGTFDMENMDSFTTPGLSLFMQLPLPMNASEAYHVFVEKAKALAACLNADLYDDQFNLISNQIINHNLEKINAYTHDLLIAEKASH